MKFKELRLQKQLTQDELSKKIGITQFTYSNYEKSKTEPDLKTLIKIANFYNVSLDYLCDRPFNNNIGFIPEDKKEIIKLILDLPKEETTNLYYYLLGKTGKQFTKENK